MLSQSLMQRKPKADVARQFVGVLTKDAQGRPKTLVVPGSGGKQYHVIVRRVPEQNLVTLECNLLVGASGMQPCPGNSVSGTICYHARAALDYVINKAGMKVAWCEELQDVVRLVNLHLHSSARYYNVRSHSNGKQVYVVVWGGTK